MNTVKSSKPRTALATALLVAVALLSVAGSRGVKAEPGGASTSTGVWMVVTHQVYDYALWRRAHDRSAASKRSRYGWDSCAVFAVGGDRNHVMVMERFASLERAQAFADSTDLRDEMAASGVSSNPEIRFLTTLEGIALR